MTSELDNGQRIEDRIQWHEVPAQAQPNYIPIVSPKPKRPVSAIVLSPTIRGVFVHWIGNRSVPCSEPCPACDWCAQGAQRKWKGYLAGFDPLSGRIALLELTTNAVRSSEALRSRNSLRGARLILTRLSERPNASVGAVVHPFHASFGFSLQELPKEPNVAAALWRIWHGE